MFNLSNVLLLVISGLIYDNLIIACGRFIGEGAVLTGLSNARFWIHALFTPTLILFAWRICFELGLPWAKTTISRGLAYFLTIGLIIYELVAVVRILKLEPKWEKGVLTYESISQSDFPIMIICITLIIGIVGIILMKKFHFYWLLIGTVVIATGSFLAIWIKTFPIMNVLEFVFIALGEKTPTSRSVSE